MEEQYNYKQVIAYAVIGLEHYLNSGNKDNINIKDFCNLFMEPLEKIYKKKDRSYFEKLEKEAEQLAKDNDCPFVDNETPYGRAKKGHPVIVDYFYHEEVRGSNNTGKRNKK